MLRRTEARGPLMARAPIMWHWRSMDGYNLELFTMLVVEDNPYMQKLLSSVLYTLKVGKIVTAADGGEAIEKLRLIGKDPIKAGGMSVDIVMSNWVMSPVDGLTLLKWLRSDKESPDRFMPFVMVSGTVDRDKIETARGAGVTEFLAKPYSVSSLATRLLAVIDNPRQFVLVPEYLGLIAGAAGSMSTSRIAAP